jgi:hypothetical protein
VLLQVFDELEMGGFESEEDVLDLGAGNEVVCFLGGQEFGTDFGDFIGERFEFFGLGF